MAEPGAEAPPDPAAVELDRLLDELWLATEMAEGLTSTADLVAGQILDSDIASSLKSAQDGQCLGWLLKEAKCAAARAKSLVSDVEDHLGAGGGCLGGPPHSGSRRRNGG